VDTQTRHALKQDKYVETTATAVDWMAENRSRLLAVVIPVAIVLLLVIGALVYGSQRIQAGDVALGDALNTYSAPLARPGAPSDPGTFPSAAARAQAADAKFEAVARQFRWLPVATRARYFSGLAKMDMGQTGAAESTLKQVADGGNRDMATLAELALANLYSSTGRSEQAVAELKKIVDKPSSTLPAGAAQLQLAALYASMGRTAEARSIYAALKDSDKTGPAGQIAAQKLAELK
jgi:tetratricopeptide (TPR) repeat protein